jgi:hypothetical protein
MSFTRENIISIVSNNPDEICAVMNSMHMLGVAYTNFVTVCSSNGIKPKSKKHGKTRPPSKYNLFGSHNKDHPELKDLAFGERAKKLSEMWKVAQTKPDEMAKYEQLHVEAKQTFDTNQKNKQLPVVDAVVVEAVAVDAVAEAPKALKEKKEKKVKAPKEPKVPKEKKGKKVPVVVPVPVVDTENGDEDTELDEDDVFVDSDSE